ncbi:hypothetical protein DSM106972_099340 [Dulcicalothrix desertica PCC 7102]|uniref:Uncharacterized protein n=1 Tax=Dulcicalothrix desertica PCC 7102 TaxID=232991 RepID=A0A3S1AHJ1_9CYAN|nr:hypothetical protein [Dulcicalothrix desertica]RUS92360.1 hypothetical protein DSM106972_099340 [Dulcicalothrix desertica PCC 7102]TWH62836.1 hypothetical protein CAL7102_00370 [Dulcicalothrix desertica PCC 7102]
MINKRLWILLLLFISVTHVIIVTNNILNTGESGGAGGDAGSSSVPTAEPTDAGAATTPPAQSVDKTSIPDGADEALKKVVETRPGQIAFNVPDKMKVNDAEVVEVVISDDLRRDLKKELGNQSGTETAQLQVSSFLRARLEGANFNTKSLNEENRFLIQNGIAAWRWSVTPTEAGEQKLYMSIYARVRKNGSTENVDLKTFQREISVSVSPTSWLNQNWKWVIENSTGIGAILAGISIFIVARWKWVRKKIKSLNKQGASPTNNKP